MNDNTGEPTSEEKVFLQFQIDLEKRGVGVVEEYARQYPHLAGEFRALAHMDRLLDGARPEAAVGMPERLGEFRLVREVARGRMGVVYEAVQERLGRRVDVKTIRHGHVTPEARERFLREQEILARLHQSHVVPIYTADEADGLQYFAMPYIEGVSLHAVVQAVRRVAGAGPGSKTPSLGRLVELASSEDDRRASCQLAPTDEGKLAAYPTKLSADYFRAVARLMADVADAVQHAHEVGILHRDLKPSNLMVDAQEQCWIIDFGLGRYLGEAAEAGAGRGAGAGPATASGLMGTPQYMAPEQIAGKVDERSDVWGLGVTLYELLTLRRAFDGETHAAVFEQVLTGEPVAARARVANVPEDLAAVCRKAMRKAAGERYASAKAFGEDVRRWLNGAAVEARGWQPVRRVGLWARRNKGWAAAAVAGMLALLMFWAGSFLYLRAEAENSRADAEQQKARQAEALRELTRLLNQVQFLRFATRHAEWSKTAWQLAEKAAAIRKDEDVRDQAAATLIGLDGRLVKSWEPLPSSSVAVDNRGRVLMGGADPDVRWGSAAAPARLWDGTNEPLHLSKQVGAGPVAFAPDGTALQLVLDANDQQSLLLRDVSRQRKVRAFRAPAGEAKEKAPPLLALMANGTYVSRAEAGGVRICSVATGELVGVLAGRASAIAATPDGSLAAVGDETGKINLCTLPSA